MGPVPFRDVESPLDPTLLPATELESITKVQSQPDIPGSQPGTITIPTEPASAESIPSVEAAPSFPSGTPVLEVAPDEAPDILVDSSELVLPTRSTPEDETSNTLIPPQILLYPGDSPLSTRPGTPNSDVSTVTTAATQSSELSPDDDGSCSPKPVQLSPPLLSVPEAPIVLPEIPTLDLTMPTLLPQHRRASSQIGHARSSPGSPTLQPTSEPRNDISKSCPVSPQLRPATARPAPKPARPRNPFQIPPSRATQEWVRRKRMDGEESKVLDELMQYQGLEEVKQQFLDIKSKADVCKEQDPDGKLEQLKKERFNIVFQGNPGTGKTTVARLYAKFLHELGILRSSYLKETSGIKAAANGVHGMKQKINTVRGKGGVLFVDEAYQLMAPYIDGTGRQVLDVILTKMEKHIGSLAVVFVGYKDEMEPFFEHNPGLASRIPYTMNFADFNDGELWKIFTDNIARKYGGRMRVEGGLDGLYVRIAIRRLAQGRGSRGFGNARAVENLIARIAQRQAQRLAREKQYCRRNPDYFLFSKEDLIGPDPFVAAEKCSAMAKLQELIGLDSVKGCVRRLVGMIKLNYQRELREQAPLKFSLNQLFVGAPGTGKTTVAKLYGQILAELGYLSRGDVVLKNPADFIGECLGKSEAKTKKILEATVGKILVIDEAYMLDAGDPNKEQDKFKTGVIDTIVSMIQGVPGEDRCIILVGYEDKIRNMFHNVNPGLSRRFPIEWPFRFENFTVDQLEEILKLKLREQELVASQAAMDAARDIFERALMRPNFTNAGEVDNVLAKAKMNYESRQSLIPHDQQNFDSELDPTDFDPEFNRGERLELDCRGMLDGLVHNSIINKLVGYQMRCRGARQHGLNPRDQVPTNFVFKGMSGTGKTTTAQHMGKLFYNMGFLSTSEVIECSAIDLLGQYVGQTVPKTRKKLQEGLGRVLFIDEAYRLMYGSYAAEAVDELIHFLSQPANIGKIIVILAGFTADMHTLMSLHPALSGLFPEEIVFDRIPDEDCITLLFRELEHNRVRSANNFLANPDSTDYIAVKRLFHVLSVVPGWSNARDVKNLAKQMLGQFLQATTPGEERVLSAALITGCMWQMITQRRDRLTTLGCDGNVACLQQAPPRLGSDNQQLAPPPPQAQTDIHTPEAGQQSRVEYQTSHHVTPAHIQDNVPAYIQDDDPTDIQEDDSDDEADFREPGVSDADWRELRQAQRDESIERGRLKAEEKRLKRALEDAEAEVSNNSDGDNDGCGPNGVCDALRSQLSAIQKKMLDEERVHQALQQMGRCVYGYCWNRVLGGYRCEGGSHYITDGELQAKMA